LLVEWSGANWLSLATHVRRGAKSAPEDALKKCESIYSPEAIAIRPYWHPFATDDSEGAGRKSSGKHRLEAVKVPLELLLRSAAQWSAPLLYPFDRSSYSRLESTEAVLPARSMRARAAARWRLLARPPPAHRAFGVQLGLGESLPGGPIARSVD
jgi:hypothetical protein